MGIYQQATLTFSGNGDGTTISQTIDFTKQVDAPFAVGGPFAYKPVNGIVVLVQPQMLVLLPNQQYTTIYGTAEVTGNILTVTWASAPPAATAGTSGNSATVTLGY